eukprot:3515740-Rhodomonas_salina.2
MQSVGCKQVEQALAAASAKAGSAEAREALTSAKSNLDTIRGLLVSTRLLAPVASPERDRLCRRCWKTARCAQR